MKDNFVALKTSCLLLLQFVCFSWLFLSFKNFRSLPCHTDSEVYTLTTQYYPNYRPIMLSRKIDNTQQNITNVGSWRKDVNRIVSQCNKQAQKEYKTMHDWGWKGDPQGIVQETEIWPSYQIVNATTIIHPREWDAWYSKLFWYTNGLPILGQKIRPRVN